MHELNYERALLANVNKLLKKGRHCIIINTPVISAKQLFGAKTCLLIFQYRTIPSSLDNYMSNKHETIRQNMSATRHGTRQHETTQVQYDTTRVQHYPT